MPKAPSDDPVHYDFIQRAFHWSMAGLILAAVALGFWASFLPRGTPLRVELLDVHKSLGMTALLLILPRILYRLFSRVPPEPADSSPPARAAAKIVHILLYGLMLVMPVAGYTFSAAGGYSLPWFGLFSWPRLLPHDPVLAHADELVHLWGAWLVYAVVAMHVAAVGWHELITGNSVLVRMLPNWRSKSA
jgi:cytochrome b561